VEQQVTIVLPPWKYQLVATLDWVISCSSCSKESFIQSNFCLFFVRSFFHVGPQTWVLHHCRFSSGAFSEFVKQYFLRVPNRPILSIAEFNHLHLSDAFSASLVMRWTREVRLRWKALSCHVRRTWFRGSDHVFIFFSSVGAGDERNVDNDEGGQRGSGWNRRCSWRSGRSCVNY